MKGSSWRKASADWHDSAIQGILVFIPLVYACDPARISLKLLGKSVHVLDGYDIPSETVERLFRPVDILRIK